MFEPSVVSSPTQPAKKYTWRLEPGVSLSAMFFDLQYRKVPLIICLPSQVGCAQGCFFCATGRKPFYRNLDANELRGIVDCIVNDDPNFSSRAFECAMMGVGEPLLNYDAISSFLHQEERSRPLFKQVNISTVGVLDGICHYADDQFQRITTKLQISVHSAFDDSRSKMMPGPVQHPLEEVLRQGAYFAVKKQRQVSLNYLLFEGINDDAKSVEELIRKVAPHRTQFYIKLSHWNSVQTSVQLRSPDLQKFQETQRRIQDAGIRCKIYAGFGNDVYGNCGQMSVEKTSTS